MDFLTMIAVGVLGLIACARVFMFLVKLMSWGFDELEDKTLNRRRKG